MVIIKNVDIISENSLEAEILISDGINELICFSQPCNFTKGQKIIEPVYCFNNKNVIKSINCNYAIEKLKEEFTYNLTGKLVDKKNNLVKIGDILLQLEKGCIPIDILENKYISFYCQRIDIY